VPTVSVPGVAAGCSKPRNFGVEKLCVWKRIGESRKALRVIGDRMMNSRVVKVRALVPRDCKMR
jgi:hypothetical protein